MAWEIWVIIALVLILIFVSIKLINVVADSYRVTVTLKTQLRNQQVFYKACVENLCNAENTIKQIRLSAEKRKEMFETKK